MAKTGKVIVLNGTSSSGKTTLAKLIQSLSSDVYLHLSLDAFWDMTPSHVPAGSNHFPNMKRAMAKSVRGLCETGHKVIVDMIFCGDKTQREFCAELQVDDICFVKVDCATAELNNREASRGDRKIGLAESQLETTHTGVKYDFIVDTTEGDLTERVEELLNSFQNP